MTSAARATVVHLLDPDRAGDESVLACRAALTIDADHHVWLIGNDATEDRVRCMGVDTTDRVAPSLSSDRAVLTRLKRLWQDRFRSVTGRPDVFQAWCGRSGRLAWRTHQRPTRVCCCVGTPRGQRLPDTPELLLATTSGALARSMQERRFTACVHLPVPHVRFEPLDRQRLRRQLGVPSDSVLVGLMDDRSGVCDARRLAFLMGLVYVLGRRTVGLVPAGVPGIARANRFVRAHGRLWSMREWSGPMLPALAACDVALWYDGPTGAIPSGAAWLDSLSEYVTVVAPDTPVVREALNGRGHVVGSGDPSLLATGLLDAISLPEKPIGPANRSDAFARTLAAAWEERLPPDRTMTHSPRVTIHEREAGVAIV